MLIRIGALSGAGYSGAAACPTCLRRCSYGISWGITRRIVIANVRVLRRWVA